MRKAPADWKECAECVRRQQIVVIIAVEDVIVVDICGEMREADVCSLAAARSAGAVRAVCNEHLMKFFNFRTLEQ